VIAAAEAVLTFAYMFGQSAQPASARLYLWLDTLVGLVAAWGISALSARVAAWRKALGGDGRSALLAVPVCAVLFAIQVPIASEGRFMNALILTRDAAQEWRFFEQLGDKRILVLADRPGLFTIMDYGALDISIAGADRNCLFELEASLSRHLCDSGDQLPDEAAAARLRRLAGRPDGDGARVPEQRFHLHTNRPGQALGRRARPCERNAMR
jgi:hypothetical protein